MLPFEKYVLEKQPVGLNDKSKSVTHANVRPPEGKSQVNTGLLVRPGLNSVQSILVDMQQRDTLNISIIWMPQSVKCLIVESAITSVPEIKALRRTEFNMANAGHTGLKCFTV